jgi:hypothetical protein
MNSDTVEESCLNPNPILSDCDSDNDTWLPFCLIPDYVGALLPDYPHRFFNTGCTSCTESASENSSVLR